MATCDRNELRDVSSAVLAVTSHLSVHDVLKTIVASARRLLDAEYAALGVPDDTGSFQEFVADGVTAEQWRKIGPLPRQHGLLGVLLRDPKPLRLKDIRTHPRFEGWPAAHPDMTDFIGVPIRDDTEVLGELFLANKCSPGGFTADDEELLSLLAGHAAIALVNARLYERSRELSIIEERNRIAHELHDAVAQKLFSLRLTTEAAASLVASDPDRAAAELDTVRRLAADASEELHAIVVGLRPVDLAGVGLEAALRGQAELLDHVHRASVRFVSVESVPRVAAAQEEAAYRIAQEALHNALQHADAGRIDIALSVSTGRLRLEITDDGSGMSAAPASSERLGLSSMRERARAVGGSCTVTSSPGVGTTIRFEVGIDA